MASGVCREKEIWAPLLNRCVPEMGEAPALPAVSVLAMPSAGAKSAQKYLTKRGEFRECRKRAKEGKCPAGYEPKEFLPGQTCCYKIVGYVPAAPKRKVVRRKTAAKRKTAKRAMRKY